MHASVLAMAVAVAVGTCGSLAEASSRLPVGVGVDAIDLLFHYLPRASGGIQSPRNRTFAQESMRQACQENGFTTIRAAGVGFWPVDLAVWQSDPDTWWDSVKTAIADAEAANCSLVLTLFWNPFCFPDLNGEPLPSIGDKGSKTWSMMSSYASGLVHAVGDSPAVIAWETTNELNLLMDLNMQGRKAGIAPSMGTPTQRTSADNISTAVGVQFGANVVSLLREIDPLQRPISGGYSMPRSSAYHLMQSYPTGKEDFTLDTLDQFKQMLSIIHAPFEVASAHLYARPGPDGNVRFNSTPVGPYDTGFLEIFGETILGMGKQPFLGEFGDPLPGARPWAHAVLPALGAATSPQSARTGLSRRAPADAGSARPSAFAHASESSDLQSETGIAAALVWCWEFYQMSPTVAANFSLLPGRDDAIISLMRDTNARLRN